MERKTFPYLHRPPPAPVNTGEKVEASRDGEAWIFQERASIPLGSHGTLQDIL